MFVAATNTQTPLARVHIKIKDNLQGSNSRADELTIKSMIWNIRKQKTTNQNNKKKKESKNMRVV